MSGKINSLDEFLALLKGVNRVSDKQFMAICPGHNDTNPSLSISERKGKILIHCFGGCDITEILKKMNLKPNDLSIENQNKQVKRIVNTYDYFDETGELVYQTVRYEPKDFRQRRPGKNGKWIWNLKGVTPVLYHLPEVLNAIRNNVTIFLLEGEKDVGRLNTLGLVATTNPMGAGKWHNSYTEALREADLVIIPDKDKPGYAHAENIAKAVYGVAKRVRVVYLPGDCKDISDWLDGDGDIEQLKRLVADCSEHNLSTDRVLTEISVTNRHLRDITSDALQAMYESNKPEHIFIRSGMITRVRSDEKGQPFIEILKEYTIRGILARCCDFVRFSTKVNKIPISPPLDVVRDIISLDNLRFPPLLGITEIPMMRADGTLINNLGYDTRSSLYYIPSPELRMLHIPDNPSKGDLKNAVDLVLELICDFPFDCEASKANAIAILFTIILRPMIDGPVPFTIIDKPQAGTGASLLAEVISIITSGRAAAMMTAQKDDEGWRKVIISLLLKGQLVVTIDNVDSTLWAPSLAAILTADTFQDRILGRSEMVTLPNKVTWIATGNNIKLAGDLPRRCIWVRLDAKMARPWQRDVVTFKHPHLKEWVLKNRGNLLASILTIANAWVVAGKPVVPELPSLGGYESYCRVIGGVLSFIGVDSFLNNLDQMYNDADIETPQWEGFLEAWHELIGINSVTVADVIKYLNNNEDFHASLPENLAGKDSRDYNRRLGKALSKHNGMRYPNGLMITKSGQKRRAVAWQVVSYRNDNSPDVELKGELVELPTNPSYGITEYSLLDNGEINSPNSSNSSSVYIPDYPNCTCPICGCDEYRLVDSNIWFCSKCHPDLKGGDGSC